jgi:hypothetical protein
MSRKNKVSRTVGQKAAFGFLKGVLAPIKILRAECLAIVELVNKVEDLVKTAAFLTKTAALIDLVEGADKEAAAEAKAACDAAFGPEPEVEAKSNGEEASA